MVIKTSKLNKKNSHDSSLIYKELLDGNMQTELFRVISINFDSNLDITDISIQIGKNILKNKFLVHTNTDITLTLDMQAINKLCVEDLVFDNVEMYRLKDKETESYASFVLWNKNGWLYNDDNVYMQLSKNMVHPLEGKYGVFGLKLKSIKHRASFKVEINNTGYTNPCGIKKLRNDYGIIKSRWTNDFGNKDAVITYLPVVSATFDIIDSGEDGRIQTRELTLNHSQLLKALLLTELVDKTNISDFEYYSGLSKFEVIDGLVVFRTYSESDNKQEDYIENSKIEFIEDTEGEAKVANWSNKLAILGEKMTLSDSFLYNYNSSKKELILGDILAISNTAFEGSKVDKITITSENTAVLKNVFTEMITPWSYRNGDVAAIKVTPTDKIAKNFEFVDPRPDLKVDNTLDYLRVKFVDDQLRMRKSTIHDNLTSIAFQVRKEQGDEM